MIILYDDFIETTITELYFQDNNLRRISDVQSDDVYDDITTSEAVDSLIEDMNQVNNGNF